MAADDDITRATLDRSRERWRKRVADAARLDAKERARNRKSSRASIDDRESEDAITGVHDRLDEIVERISRVHVEAPRSLQPGPNDSKATRAAKLALGSMHRHQRGWLVFAVLLIAFLTFAWLVVEGRVKLVSDWIDPPREASPPWGGEPQVRPRHKARASLAEPETEPEPTESP